MGAWCGAPGVPKGRPGGRPGPVSTQEILANLTFAVRAEHIGCVWGIRFPTWSPSALCSTKWLDKPVTGAVGHIVKQTSEQPPKYLVQLLFSFRGVSEVEVPVDHIHGDK